MFEIGSGVLCHCLGCFSQLENSKHPAFAKGVLFGGLEVHQTRQTWNTKTLGKNTSLLGPPSSDVVGARLYLKTSKAHPKLLGSTSYLATFLCLKKPSGMRSRSWIGSPNSGKKP